MSDADRHLRALENAVLCSLGDLGDDYYVDFRWLSRNTGLSRDMVRAIVRGLTDQGLARYTRGLMTEDGDVCGAGYGITTAGRVRLLSIAEIDLQPQDVIAGALS